MKCCIQTDIQVLSPLMKTDLSIRVNGFWRIQAYRILAFKYEVYTAVKLNKLYKRTDKLSIFIVR